MDYTKMDLEELKELAKSRGLKVGNIGKDKLIAKLKENDTFSVVTAEDEDLSENTTQETPVVENKIEEKSGSLLDAISETIDELDESVDDKDDYDDTLELDTSIPVKSITFGGLTYKSRSTNAVFRWNQIGAIQYMTVAELDRKSVV